MQCFPQGAPWNSGFPRSENIGFAKKRNYVLKCYIIIKHETSVLGF